MIGQKSNLECLNSLRYLELEFPNSLSYLELECLNSLRYLDDFKIPSSADLIYSYQSVSASRIDPIPIPSLPKNWKKGKLIGGGFSASVYEAISGDGTLFAVKELSLDDESSRGEQRIKHFEQEILLLSQFHHENIVRYLGTERDDKKLYIFLELLSKGSLRKLYQEYDLQDSQVSAYTRQILSGLIYLHARKVVHRDIKCANILVGANGSVKLADFGLSKELNEIMSSNGSPYWMAPEVIKSDKANGYGLAADIWSLGCVVLEMLTSKYPYYHLEPLPACFKIAHGELPEIPNTLSVDAKDFILTCLQADPTNRPTAEQLLSHPYVTRS